MSLCPTKDIHSVYLDNELPLAYVKEYEEHIQSCSKCSAELEKLKKIRGMMNVGSRPELSQLEMDEGFKRLQIRMSYSKHTKAFETKSMWKSVATNTYKYVVPAMAAAAVFALVLPFGLKSGKDKSVESAASQTPAIASVPVPEVSTQMVSNMANVPNIMNNGMSGMRPHMMHPGMRSGMHSGVASPSLASIEQTENLPQVVDVFRPNFDNENKISIQITFPGINSTSYTTEIGFPADMYKGSLSETD